MTRDNFDRLLLKDFSIIGDILYDAFDNEYEITGFSDKLKEIYLLRLDNGFEYYLNYDSCWKFNFNRFGDR